MEGSGIIYFIPIVAILGGFAVVITVILSGMRLRELRIRERIAMIEKGLVPPPEVDPAGFDRAMGRYDRHGPYGRRGSGRHRRAGITVMGLGFGLMLLISMSAESPQTGIGVGGFLVILGLAFLINSFFEGQQDRQTPLAPPPAPPAPPPSQG